MKTFAHYLAAVRSTCASCFGRVFGKKRTAFLFAVALLLLGGFSYFALAAPANFLPGTIVRVPYGASVPEVATEIADAHIISHPALLRLILRVSGESGKIQSGVYKFAAPQDVVTVAHRLITGAYDLPLVRITFVEGMTVREAAQRIASTSLNVSPDEFLAAGRSQEGYLFPDTYFFQPSMDAASIVAMMRANFDAKIAPLMNDIRASGHSLSDIVTMASLIEKEGRTTATRGMIAGILWNRIARGMPLQVDAVFGYIFNRDTYSPSLADLTIDSPYNTYTHRGLPPGPIDNPGLDSLEAAIHPTPTNYLYYLTDKEGVIHYAMTYAGHLANQRKYLK
ncbi:MAG: endolytic transglycosylase MltG [Minisyncoccota bacterium]